MLDETDKAIIQLLREDGRRTVRDIAGRVGLTIAPVKRRIDKLEEEGVITGYTARVDPARVDGELEAIVELRVMGNLDLHHILDISDRIPEIIEVLTLAGDPDALARVRAANIQDLQRVVNRIRNSGKVTGTKTQVVLNSWSRFG
ncbi:Lrp/AsnC family transcriptional regulator [Gordonia terrae]